MVEWSKELADQIVKRKEEFPELSWTDIAKDYNMTSSGIQQGVRKWRTQPELEGGQQTEMNLPVVHTPAKRGRKLGSKNKPAVHGFDFEAEEPRPTKEKHVAVVMMPLSSLKEFLWQL